MTRIKRRSIWTAATLLLSVATLTYAHDELFRVEIKTTQTVVKTNHAFTIRTTVRNISGNAQTLRVWSCSYENHWTADQPAVHTNNEICSKNLLVDVRLKPGEAYERDVLIFVYLPPRLPQEMLTFRLAFRQFSKESVADADVPLIWSNPLTVTVEE